MGGGGGGERGRVYNVSPNKPDSMQSDESTFFIEVLSTVGTKVTFLNRCMRFAKSIRLNICVCLLSSRTLD